MTIHIDLAKNLVVVDGPDGDAEFSLDSPQAFEAVSRAWVRAGWDTKYVYSFSWLGRPIIQLPDDMIRIQEVIHAIRPSLIVETGVAHGGSLIFYATLCKAVDHGRVLGIDIEIRPHNRRAIEEHTLSSYIDLIEGSSTDADVVRQVKDHIGSDDVVLVLLDSNHTRAHVLAELHAYAPMVTVGSYIVATDGIMSELVGAPRSAEDWATNNPRTAVRDFLEERDDFELVEPPFPFNEGVIQNRVTYWPDAYLRRVR